MLTGHIRPSVRFPIWWRLKFFRWSLFLQRRFGVAPRVERFSLLNAESLCAATSEPADLEMVSTNAG